jgi:DNA/RNA endonuclease YhcR with UshA esterase domain
MRMQKEEKTAVVLLLMALGSLSVAFWAFGSDESLLGIATSTEIEQRISVEGIVVEMNPTKSGGNLIIELDSTPLPVFVPRDSGANGILSRIGLGDRIQANGVLWEYNGNKEIKLERSEDLEKIDDV